MSRIIVAALCVLFAGISHAQDNPVFDAPGPDYVMEGDEVDLSCKTDADLQFMASKQLAIVHKNLATETETLVSEQESLLVTPPENYDIKLEMMPIVRVNLKIKAASAGADGEYTCRTQKTGDNKAIESTTKEVIFLAPVSSIKLTVDGEDRTDGDTISSKPKTMMVTCEAMGSNPAPLLHVKQDGKPLDIGVVNTILDKDGNKERRSYKASATFDVEFSYEMFGQVLECHAEPELPEGVTIPSPADKKISVTLEGIVDKPMVQCTNNTAGVNDRRVTLTCLVSKKPKVKSIMFNVGNKHLLYPGNQTKSLTEVLEKDYNATHTEVILKFFEMEEWHFTANIYLDVKGYDGQVFQYPVYLMRGDTPTETTDVNGATSLTGAITMSIVCLLAGLLQKVL